MDSPSLATMLSAQSKLAKQLQDDVMNDFDLSIGNSVVKFTNTKQATLAQTRAEMRKWPPMNLKASAQKLQMWLGTPFRHGGGAGQDSGKRKRVGGVGQDSGRGGGAAVSDDVAMEIPSSSSGNGQVSMPRDELQRMLTSCSQMGVQQALLQQRQPPQQPLALQNGGLGDTVDAKLDKLLAVKEAAVEKCFQDNFDEVKEAAVDYWLENDSDGELKEAAVDKYLEDNGADVKKAAVKKYIDDNPERVDAYLENDSDGEVEKAAIEKYIEDNDGDVKKAAVDKYIDDNPEVLAKEVAEYLENVSDGEVEKAAVDKYIEDHDDDVKKAAVAKYTEDNRAEVEEAAAQKYLDHWCSVLVGPDRIAAEMPFGKLKAAYEIAEKEEHRKEQRAARKKARADRRANNQRVVATLTEGERAAVVASLAKPQSSSRVASTSN